MKIKFNIENVFIVFLFMLSFNLFFMNKNEYITQFCHGFFWFIGAFSILFSARVLFFHLSGNKRYINCEKKGECNVRKMVLGAILLLLSSLVCYYGYNWSVLSVLIAILSGHFIFTALIALKYNVIINIKGK